MVSLMLLRVDGVSGMLLLIAFTLPIVLDGLE